MNAMVNAKQRDMRKYSYKAKFEPKVILTNRELAVNVVHSEPDMTSRRSFTMQPHKSCEVGASSEGSFSPKMSDSDAPNPKLLEQKKPKALMQHIQAANLNEMHSCMSLHEKTGSSP